MTILLLILNLHVVFTTLTVQVANFCAGFNILVDAKTTYYRDKADNCEQSKLFKLAESLLHGKEKKSLPDHKNLITLVDEFNQFFIMKIVNIRLKLESARHMLPLTNSSSPTSVTTLT